MSDQTDTPSPFSESMPGGYPFGCVPSEQPDRREAGQATPREVSPKTHNDEQPASPFSFRRELAEAIDRAVRIDRHHSRPRTPVDVITAVLAAERVVDPAEVKRELAAAKDAVDTAKVELASRRQQLTALRSAVAEAERILANAHAPWVTYDEVAAALAALRSTGEQT